MRNQKGAALVVVLALLVSALMLGLSSVQSSFIDERLAGNYRAATQAQMNAEEGASKYFDSELDKFETYVGGYWDDDIEDFLSDLKEYVEEGSDSEGFDDGGFYYALVKKNGERKIIIEGFSRDGVARRIVEVNFSRPLEEGGFPVGILSNGRVDANGQSTVVGSVHSNEGLSIKGKDFSEASLSDGIGSFQDIEGNGIYRIEVVPLPGRAPESFDENKVKYLDFFSDYEGMDSNCDVNVGSLSSGDVVYCNGDMEVSGDGGYSEEVTIIAEGNITFKGSYGKSGEPLRLFVVSGGDMTFNGSRDTYGVFWANGTIVQNGNSSMNGSIVTGGGFTPHGGIDYVAGSEISNPNVPGERDRVEWINY